MRILYLHQYFNTPEMAGSVRSYEFAKRLAKRGHEVHIITTDRSAKGSDWNITKMDGFHVHWCPVEYRNQMNFSRRVAAFIHFAFRAGYYSAKIHVDVVFATSTPLTIALPAVYAARRQGIPMVFEVRDLWPEMPIAIGTLRNPLTKMAAKWLERFAYRNAKRIVALSETMAEGVARTGYPADHISVIHNSADLDRFKVSADTHLRQSLEISPDHTLITYAGTLGEVNGVDYLVKIAATAKKSAPNLRFLIVGRGREAERIKLLAKEHDVLNHNLFLIPEQPSSEIPKIHAASDIMLSLFIDLVEMHANSANKFFDALAAGRPIAINYGGWQSELLESTGAGIRLPANDPKAAAISLQTYAASKNLSKAGIAARQLAEQKFSRDLHANQLEELLYEAVDTH